MCGWVRAVVCVCVNMGYMSIQAEAQVLVVGVCRGVSVRV